MKTGSQPNLVILNQMAGPMTWELAVDAAARLGCVALLTGHPDSLRKVAPDGLSVFRSVTYKRGSPLRRITCWCGYVLHAFVWLWRWPRTVPVLVFSNPPFGIWLARLMKLLRGTPYTVMVHDIYPDVIVTSGLAKDSNLVIRCWRWLNRGAYESASAVMTLGDYMANIVSQQFDVSRTDLGVIRIVPPWADTEQLGPIPKADNWFAQEHGLTDKITVMYSGNMGLGHDLESVLEVAEQLSSDSRFHFVFIGAGPKWDMLNQAQQRKRLPNVTLLGWQPESVIAHSLAAADLAIVSLERELTGLAVPSKAFYFLAAGAPLVVLCEPDCELADVVREFECGTQLPPQQPDQLRNVLLNDAVPGGKLVRWKAGALVARDRFSRHRGTSELIAIATGGHKAPDVCTIHN